MNYKNKEQPGKQIRIQSIDKYPFGILRQPTETTICLVKNTDDKESDIMKSVFNSHEKLRHPNLVQLVKIVQSRKNRQYEVFYQYVPHDLTSRIKTMTRQQIQGVKESLQKLCQYLIFRNFVPQIEPVLIGVDTNNNVKYFLPLSKREQVLPADKTSIIRLKKAEISRMINDLLMFKANQVEFGRSKSNQNIVSQEFRQNTVDNTLDSQNPARRSQAILSTNSYSPQQRNSHNIQPLNFVPFQRSSADLQVLRIPGNTLRNKSEAESLNIRGPILDHLNKLKNIDERIKQLQTVKNSGVGFNIEEKRKQLCKQVRKSQMPEQPPPPPAQPPPIKKIQVQKVPARPQPKRLSPPVVDKKRHMQFDQQSVDTYHQELGEIIQMPKMVTGGGLRNTTLAPTKNYQEKTKDKLSESVGFKQELMIPLNQAGTASVRSQVTEKKPPTIQYSSAKAFQQGKAKASKKPQLKTQKTEPTLSKQLVRSVDSKPTQQIVRQVSAQMMHTKTNNQNGQHTHHISSHQLQMSPNLNLNVSVAVNLNDLTRKVDAAFGRVRAASQNNEEEKPQLPKQQAQQPQPNFSKPTPKKPAIPTGKLPTIQIVPPPNPQSPSNQPPKPKDSSPKPIKIQEESPSLPNHISIGKPKYPINSVIPQLQVPYSNKRKHSSTTPNIALFSPMALESYKKSTPSATSLEQDTLKIPTAEGRKDSHAEIEEDFKKLENRKNHKDSGVHSIDDDRSRQYLYRYQNLFPDQNIGENRDDISVRNPQCLQRHLDELYNQSLKFDKNDVLVSEFNTLFQAESNRKKSYEARKVRSHEVTQIDNEQSSTKQINQRVKQALKKSQATLEHFNKLKKSPQAKSPDLY